MPRYSVTIAASADVSLAATSSTTATFSARGFSVVMYTSSRFNSGARIAANTARSEGTGATRSARSSPRLVGTLPFFGSVTTRASGLRRATCSLSRQASGRRMTIATLGASGRHLGAQAGRVDLDARAHRRRHRDLLQVATLRGSRLGSLQLVEDGAEVAL